MIPKTVVSRFSAYITSVDKHLLIGTIVSLLMFINIYILLSTPPAEHYEVSIYTTYPRLFWTNSVTILWLTTLWLVLGKSIKNKLLVVILVINQLTLILLPLFRGYFIYGRSDELGHLGRAKEILITTHVGNDNFYPILHIIISELKLVAGASLNSLTILLPPFFWLMLLLWYFLFVFNLTHNINLGKFSVLIWMMFPLGSWHTALVGNMFSYVFMFLILAVWFSSIKESKKYFLTTVLYLNLVFFHPLTSMYLLMIFVIFDLLNLRLGFKRDLSFVKNLGIIVIVVWTIWHLSFLGPVLTLRAFWYSIGGSMEGINKFVSMYVANIEKYNIPILRTIKFAIYRYFGVMILGMLATSFIINFFKNKKFAEIPTTIFLPFFIVFVTWSGLNIFIHFVNFERSFRYVVAFSIPLAGRILYEMSKRYKIDKKQTTFILILFLIFSYFAIFTIHASPLMGHPNHQVSASEYYGMGWWFERRDYLLIGYEDTQISQYRFYGVWYGRYRVHTAKMILSPNRGQSLIPEHFGYYKYELAGNGFSNPTYFIMGRVVWEYYNATIWDRVDYWRWKPEELLRLRSDPTVNLLYSSEDISIYLIIPYGKGV
ncbi:hypothetical protein EP1X_01280 [Thermococcus sp. EP1]|uniref:hypothetical protein n=1 Tax=Thermococcus sp. EP1 TaxID=1591054 RepID=UPI0006DB8C65|nr:hypothetical protein [Thermococcus sp. EP1]KPU63859.1 hypothetical protein EP1X_01280 [Thermococcus sp. EP1]